MKKYLTFIVSSLLLTVIIIHIALLIGGYRFHAIKTDSMDPDIPKYSFVYVQSYDNKTDFYNNIGRGMDIVYKTESGDYVAHRVVHIDEFNDTLQTQSIREGASLDPKISRSDVVGKVTTVIPVIGFFVIMIQQWYFWVILATIIAAVFVVRALIKEINKDKPITKKKKAKHKK